jgi:hypothetical protein
VRKRDKDFMYLFCVIYPLTNNEFYDIIVM